MFSAPHALSSGEWILMMMIYELSANVRQHLHPGGSTLSFLVEFVSYSGDELVEVDQDPSYDHF